MVDTAVDRPRANDFELWSWLFMRISGIALLVMVLLHFAIMHLLTPIEDVNFSFVAARWATPFWRAYDLVLLLLALVHGLNGVRVVMDDYVHSRGWRLATTSGLYTVGLIFLVIGTQVILSFQPPAAR